MPRQNRLVNRRAAIAAEISRKANPDHRQPTPSTPPWRRHIPERLHVDLHGELPARVLHELELGGDR
jgi:hypothetical protein